MNESESADLSHYLDVLLRRRWIAVAITGLALMVTSVFTFTMRPLYQATSLLVIEKERGGGTVFSNGTLVENSNEDYYQTQYKLLQSYSLLEKVYQDIGLDKTEDFAQPHGVDKLVGAVKIVPIPRSRLVNIRVSSHDPALAAKVANGIGEVFVSQNLANQLFISKEILQALQARKDDPQARKLYEGLPAVVSNSLVQQLKSEYAKQEAQFAEMSQRFTPKYPAMIAIRSNMAALKAQIDGETDRIVQSLKTELSGQLRGNNVRVVDPALVPEVPVKPKKLANLVFGMIGGLLLGFLGALLAETLDQSIRTQEDVEAKLRQPFLGTIPLGVIGRTERIYESLLAKEVSLTSESFRNLRTMVDFAGVDGKGKSILVTGTVQEEGKSYVATNMAIAFAQLGESVLLMDGDLRRPKLHKNFSLPGDHGLSDFLAGTAGPDALEAVLRDSGVPSLKILPCGVRPPNPSELLNTPRVAALLSWARSRFDRIIVDCTPMFPINDTLLWGRHVPAAVYVVRYGKTRLPLIRKGTQRLEAGSVKLLGIAVNGAQASGLAYAPYGYYYQQYYHQYSQQETEAANS